jgi:RNA polymerase sigma-70 factor, ECF subfamily
MLTALAPSQPITPESDGTAISTPAEHAGLLDGDFDALVRVYRPRLFRFALASLRDSDAAQTVVQDTLLKAYQSRQSFRGDASEGTWLMQIAVNLIRDRIRSGRWRFWQRAGARSEQAADLGEALRDQARSPEQDLIIREKIAAVWEATKRLTEKQRTVFLLRYVEEMSVLEVAAATGMAEGTVKSHLARALETVRREIGQT